jgi:hypothetical protein
MGEDAEDEDEDEDADNREHAAVASVPASLAAAPKEVVEKEEPI